MRPLSLVLVLTAIWEVHAEARLGESQSDLVARYGTSTPAGNPTADFPVTTEMFHKGNWNITVELMNGVSVGEKFQNPQGKPSDEDIATLLDDNSQGLKWTEQAVSRPLLQMFIPLPTTLVRKWQRDDGATAELTGSVAFFLELKSKQLLDAEKAKDGADTKAKQPNLQGF